NLVAHENEAVRHASAEIARQHPDMTLRALETLSSEVRLKPEPAHDGGARGLTMPRRHELLPELDVASPYLEKILLKTYERAPENFETLLGIEGVGPRTLRALSLASDLLHGSAATMRDPARFSFAHGGKDGTPYPVDKI